MTDPGRFRAQLDPDTRFLRLETPFPLECGERLEEVEVAYRTWGDPANARRHAVLVCHALTGSADVDRWWRDVVGPGRALDPSRDFILAQATLGSCYGTTGPTSLRPSRAGAPRRPWGADFPPITIRDQVRLQLEVALRLGLERIQLVVGGSLGGMQALEWAVLGSGMVESVAAISAPARHGPWALAFSELGRQALALDPKLRDGNYDAEDPPCAGLELARQIAMISYRSPESFELRFGRRREKGIWAVSSWLHFHGERLSDRFDANAYRTLLDAMDSHDLARGRGELATVLSRVSLPIWIVATRSDQLYPPEELEALARMLPRSRLFRLRSPHGHDAFLIEQDTISRGLLEFRRAIAGVAKIPQEVVS